MNATDLEVDASRLSCFCIKDISYFHYLLIVFYLEEIHAQI